MRLRGKEEKAYSTWDSQAVSDPSTNQARRCLTWQIGRDAVLSTWYGRKRNNDGVCRRNTHSYKLQFEKWTISNKKYNHVKISLLDIWKYI